MNRMYSLSEVTVKYAITPRTLKYYEEIGLIHSKRNYLNHRIYDDEALVILEQILWIKKTGIGLKMIKTIFETNNQTKITHIIADQKGQLSHEITRLSEMKERIEAYMSQVINENITAVDIVAQCVPANVWDINLTDMPVVPSVEYDELQKIRGMSSEQQKMPNSPYIKLTKDYDNTDVLLVSGNSARAETEVEYTIPISLFFTVKVNEKNLEIYFGDYRLVLNSDKYPSDILFYDQFLDCEFNIPGKKAIPKNEFIMIQWVLTKERTVIYINKSRIFSLEYANYHNFAVKSKIGIGTDGDNAVTVKAINYTEIGSWDMLPVELSAMRLKNNNYFHKGGNLVMFSALDQDMAGTSRTFKWPLRIDLEAKTTNTNIRISYHNGGIILNWEKDKLRLPFRDIITGKHKVLESGGFLTPNEYHTISWILHTEFTSLIVDGVCRFHQKEAPHSTVKPVADTVRIGTAFGSTVTVRRLTVTELVYE